MVVSSWGAALFGDPTRCAHNQYADQRIQNSVGEMSTYWGKHSFSYESNKQNRVFQNTKIFILDLVKTQYHSIKARNSGSKSEKYTKNTKNAHPTRNFPPLFQNLHIRLWTPITTNSRCRAAKPNIKFQHYCDVNLQKKRANS